MFLTNGSDVYISRGEEAALDVSVSSGGEPYELQTGDALILEVREHRGGGAVISIESAESPIVIEPEHTAGLRGRYDYRVLLRYASGKQVTVIGRTPNRVPRFVVMEG